MRIRSLISSYFFFLCKRGRLIYVVLCKPGLLTADQVVYILMAKNAIIFLYSQNVEMIAVLTVGPGSSPSFSVIQL